MLFSLKTVRKKCDMKKTLFILFLILTLSGISCAPIPPPESATRPPSNTSVPHPPRFDNAAEAAMAVEAGIFAIGVGLTILDIILSTQGHRGGVRSRPRHPPRR